MNTFNENGMIIPNFKDLPASMSNKVNLNKFAVYMDKIFNSSISESCTLYSHFISDYYITIDYTILKYIIPNSIQEKLEKCIHDKSIRFYILPIILKFNDTDSHANVLIVDNQKHTIELYEPHGSSFKSRSIIFNNELHIRKLISIVLKSKVYFKFTNVHYKCRMGFQIKQSQIGRPSGHCVAWVLFLIHVKLYNLHKSTEEIIDFFDKFEIQKLDSYIRKYITLIENETAQLRKLDKDYYHPFELSEKEQEYAKKLVEKSLKEYLNDVEFNKISLQGQTDIFDVGKTFRYFIIFSRYKFFHDVFFETINNFFNKNKKQI